MRSVDLRWRGRKIEIPVRSRRDVAVEAPRSPDLTASASTEVTASGCDSVRRGVMDVSECVSWPTSVMKRRLHMQDCYLWQTHLESAHRERSSVAVNNRASEHINVMLHRFMLRVQDPILTDNKDEKEVDATLTGGLPP